VSLVLAVSSTIILGLQQLNFWTGLAFSFWPSALWSAR
jgi:hypothetical protein